MLNTKSQYIKESNNLASIAIIKLHQNKILLNTKGQDMMESYTLARILASNSLPGEISKGTNEICIKVIIL